MPLPQFSCCTWALPTGWMWTVKGDRAETTMNFGGIIRLALGGEGLFSGRVVGVEAIGQIFVVSGIGVGALGDEVRFTPQPGMAGGEVWLGTVGADWGVLNIAHVAVVAKA